MTTFCCALALARCAVALAPAAEAPDYDRQVRPVLAKYCFGCHTPEEAKGDLVMTDFAKFKAGGKRGLAFVAGNASESPMIRMVEGTAKPRMPPKGNPAPGAAEVAVLRAWIDGGAKGPVAVAAAGLKYPIIAPKKSVSPSVTSIAFAPDGKTFAYAKHRTAVLVESDSGSIVREFGPNGGAVTALRFLEGGRLLLVAAGTAGHAGETRIWEVATGKQLHAIRGHADAIYGLAATAKGMRFASAGYDRVIRIWNAPDAPGPALKGHNDAVYALAFSPDGNRLASASGDRTIKLWDVVKGERLDTFSQPLQDQYAVAFRPNGRQVAAAGGDNRIRVWSIGPTGAEGTNKLLHARYAHESPIVQLVYSPDGSLLASSAQDNTVRVWRAGDVTETALLEKQPDWPTALAFFPDNKRLLVGRFDGTLATYDVTTKAKLANIEPKKKPPAAPVVESILPGGIERGKPARLRVRGKNIGAEATKVEIAGGSAKITGTAPGGALLVSATVPPTAARGPVELKVTTPGGSSAKSVLVDDIPQVEETKDNDGAPAQPAATPRSLPIAIWGTLEKRGDVDYHAFAAKKGETVVAELAGRSLGSKIKG
ncbi:MAG TPA: c-type cytochrome domain-containing protein, partial [Planctomycetia bacterium]|nr:c-type cytochrome domain-containing protein [Planctomycetia bacterium]